MSSDVPPTGFITLNEAINTPPSVRYNVMGVCVDFLPPARSRGTDETIKFTLHDPSWDLDRHDRGMTFRFFHKSRQRLPAIENSGDVVMLRNVCTKDMHGLIGISNLTTSWAVIPRGSLIGSDPTDPSDASTVTSAQSRDKAMMPSNSELQYAKFLASQANPEIFRSTTKATALEVESIMRENGGQPPLRKDKFRLIQDLELSQNSSGKFSDGQPAFADLFGEVRKIYTGDYRKVELYLTDYTINSKLYNYQHERQGRDGDNYGYINDHKSWYGPWGRMTIKVWCWDAHAEFARGNIKEGMLVLIKNCNIRMDEAGSVLEAVCRGDRDNGSKVNITTGSANDQRHKDFLQRKKDVVKTAAKSGLPMSRTNNIDSKKRPMDDPPSHDVDDESHAPKKLSKSQKKRERKKNARKLTEPNTSTSIIGNPNVRCKNIDIPVKSIENILDRDLLMRQTPSGNNMYVLPFQNCRYKLKVRVVDYFPNNIADFAVPKQPQEYDVLSDNEEDEQDTLLAIAQSNPDAVSWEWRFMLIFEDASVRTSNKPGTSRIQMPVLVSDRDADYLLNQVACDLRRDKQELAKLKEKLFLLWGDLQEKKEEPTVEDNDVAIKSHSQPFECFVTEYGVPLPCAESRLDQTGFHRMFRIHGTSI